MLTRRALVQVSSQRLRSAWCVAGTPHMPATVSVFLVMLSCEAQVVTGKVAAC